MHTTSESGAAARMSRRRNYGNRMENTRRETRDGEGQPLPWGERMVSDEAEPLELPRDHHLTNA